MYSKIIDIIFFWKSPNGDYLKEILNKYEIDFNIIYSTIKVIQIEVKNPIWFAVLEKIWDIMINSKELEIKSISFNIDKPIYVILWKELTQKWEDIFKKQFKMKLYNKKYQNYQNIDNHWVLSIE